MVKIFIKSFFVLFVFLLLNPAFGQSIHFSYIDFAPQHVNPGNIGGFLGSYRATGIYRDQYNNGSTVKGYRTFEFGIDLPVIRGFRKQDWIGAGISLDSDTRGTLALKDVYSRIGLSYHFALDKKQVSSISLGIQMIGLNRSMKTTSDQPLTPEGLLTGRDAEFNAAVARLAKDGKLSLSARDWNIGLVFTRNTKSNSFKIGVSSSGLLPSGLGFSAPEDSVSVPFKMVGFASMVNQINKTTSIEPSLLFQITEYGGKEFMFHTKVGYQIKKEKKDKVKAGLGFRTGTFSAIFLLGAEIKGINFGLSYDLPISGYAGAPGTQNGFEFGASYIGLFKKTPRPKPIVICPRL
jgi:type IX secretion system PorP/SprF family membrane protein